MSSPSNPPAGGPLDAQHRQEVAEAAKRAKGLALAGKMAAFNGWTLIVFAAVTVLFGLTSPTALVLGGAMAFLGRTELRGRALLKRFDPDGPALLANNQLRLMGAVVVYCAWSIYTTMTGPGLQVAGLEEILGDADDLVRSLTLTAYGAVIVGTVIFQGLAARYYRARVAMVEAYLEQTPDWVVELQRSGLGQ